MERGRGERIEEQKQKVKRREEKREKTQTGAMSNKPRTLILLTQLMAWLNSTGWCADVVDPPCAWPEVEVLAPWAPFVWEVEEAPEDWEACDGLQHDG